MLTFDVGCMACASPVEYVTGSQGWRTEQRAVVRCTRCRSEWVIVVRLLPARDYEPGPAVERGWSHGTIYGARKGCACDECTEAVRSYERERKRAQRARQREEVPG